MKRYWISLLLLLSLTAGMIVPASGADASETTPLQVTWHMGYVGSDGNKQGFQNCVKSASSSYRYTDVVTIEKAGTTIWFTETLSAKCHYTGYVISSWKQDAGGEWVIDLDSGNYEGSSGENSRVCRKNADGSATYTYTTSRDGEHLRFTTTAGASSDANYTYPVIYSKFTGEKGTYQIECEEDLPELEFSRDGVVRGINWFSGSVGSGTRTDGETFCYTVHENDPNYRYSCLIPVPYAGITITFTDTESNFLDQNYFYVSIWKQVGEHFECDRNAPNCVGGDPGVINDWGDQSTYTYTTTAENEYIRLCFRSDGNTEMPVVYWSGEWPEETEPVTSEESAEETDPGTAETEADSGTEALPESDESGEESAQNSGKERLHNSPVVGTFLLGGVVLLYGGYGIGRAKKRKNPETDLKK